MRSMFRPVLRERLHRGAVGAAVLTLGVITAGMAADALTSPGGLPLGREGLKETRVSRVLAPGVKLTRISRGVPAKGGGWVPATAGTMGTTANGPWRVRELEIDPRFATGHVRSTFGVDISRVETTTEMADLAGALAGTNGGFFAIGSDAAARGNPVGLAISGGVVESEPTNYGPETHLLLDAARNTVRVTKLRWRETLTNAATGTSVFVDHVNSAPRTPSGCGPRTDPTQCLRPGEVSVFTSDWGAATPAGPGVEVVFDDAACPVRTATTRGLALTSRQFSVQATGLDVSSVLNLAGLGCLKRVDTLTDPEGKNIPLTRSTFALNGRYQLLKAGRIVAPTGGESFLDRSPRTIAGTAADGRIILVTIDGRHRLSVGATLEEAAEVAKSFGMTEAINLDGGGSTVMSVAGHPANQPSDGHERPVGDALIYVPGPWRPES